jgi:hypothetical protein
VSQTRRAEAYAAITALQQTLMRRLPGVQARLWCRTDERASDAPEQTWMEVYERPEGVDALCEQVLLELVQALPAGLIGPRHVEAFAPLGSAAAPPSPSEA